MLKNEALLHVKRCREDSSEKKDLKMLKQWGTFCYFISIIWTELKQQEGYNAFSLCVITVF